MLTVADRAQQGFFDASICGGLVPKDSDRAAGQHGHRIVRDEDFADCYSDRAGRPSIPPSLLAKVLLLAYRDGLSDERAMEALRFDLRFKVALDLPIDHPGFHATSLVRFRARLLLHGKERPRLRALALARQGARPHRGLDRADRRLDADARCRSGAGHGDARALRRAQAARCRSLLQHRGWPRARARPPLRLRPPAREARGDWQDKASREALLGEVATTPSARCRRWSERRS
ncbi:MAG: transposase [Thermoleophilaceae bacterium]